MSKWFGMPPTMRMTEREYRANINGTNVVFGAVLGFVLAGAQDISTYEFVFVLLLSATTVTLIFYLGSSDYKLFYLVSTIGMIVAIPYILDGFTRAAIPKLQPTLAVWASMVLIIEMMPREKEDISRLL